MGMSRNEVWSRLAKVSSLDVVMNVNWQRGRLLILSLMYSPRDGDTVKRPIRRFVARAARIDVQPLRTKSQHHLVLVHYAFLHFDIVN